jgi:hypothetical protein
MTDERRSAVLLLGVLVLGAVLTFAMTPAWIQRYPSGVPWYESPGFFPRLGLAMLAVGGAIEAFGRWRGTQAGASEELDAGAARPRLAAIGFALFVAYALATPVIGYWPATVAFLLAVGTAAGLPATRTVPVALVGATVLWGVFAVALRVAFGRPLVLEWLGVG